MSEAIRNLGKKEKVSRKEQEKRYEEYLSDPVTFALDEMLQILGPRRETIRR